MYKEYGFYKEPIVFVLTRQFNLVVNNTKEIYKLHKIL